MSRLSDARAILAIDPGCRGLAFVAFEGGELIDWGTRAGDPSTLFRSLMDRYGTEVLVIEDAAAPGSERREPAGARLDALASEAARLGVDVVRVARSPVRRSWSALGLTRKQAVAAALAEEFPELTPLVPRPRKPWQSEKARLDIFDALTILLHAFPAQVARHDVVPRPPIVGRSPQDVQPRCTSDVSRRA